jgi:gamma-glutamylputrescine oxidase
MALDPSAAANALPAHGPARGVLATVPLWQDEPYQPRPPPTGAGKADVAIVGGGIAGASTALALAGQGLDVVLLEADGLARRASGRSAGFLISTLAEPYTQVVEERGRDAARQIWRTNEDNREAVAALVEDFGLDCGFARPGAYTAAASAKEAEALERSAALMRQDGFEARWLPLEEAQDLLGEPGRFGALFRPGDGTIQPAKLTRALAGAAEEQGVRIHEGARVQRLERPRGEGPWTLRGAGFVLEAPEVVLAANAFSEALHPWFGEVLKPVRGQVLATAPLPRPAPVPAPVYYDAGYVYWRLFEGRLVLGGRRPVARQREVGLDEALNLQVQAALDEFRREHLPATLGAAVTHRWAGIMDFSKDGLPLVGLVPGEERLRTLAGFTGHGFGYAVAMAAWVGEALLRSKDVVPGPFRSDRALPPGPVPY